MVSEGDKGQVRRNDYDICSNCSGRKQESLTPAVLAKLLQLCKDDRVKMANILWDSLNGPPDDPVAYQRAFKEELAGASKSAKLAG